MGWGGGSGVNVKIFTRVLDSDLRQVLKYGALIRTGDGKGPDIIGWVDTAR